MQLIAHHLSAPTSVQEYTAHAGPSRCAHPQPPPSLLTDLFTFRKDMFGVQKLSASLSLRCAAQEAASDDWDAFVAASGSHGGAGGSLAAASGGSGDGTWAEFQSGGAVQTMLHSTAAPGVLWVG